MAKKHVSQMSEDEVRYLTRKVGELKLNKVCSHTKERMLERGITEEEINRTLNSYHIIEYKMDQFGKQSVLIQSVEKINGYYINVVTGLNRSSVVTCFKNTYRDRDIDMSAYNERLNIRNLIQNDVKLATGYYRHSAKTKGRN